MLELPRVLYSPSTTSHDAPSIATVANAFSATAIRPTTTVVATFVAAIFTTTV